MSAGALPRPRAGFRPWREVVATVGALGELGAVLEPLQPISRRLGRFSSTASAWVDSVGIRVPHAKTQATSPSTDVGQPATPTAATTAVSPEAKPTPSVIAASSNADASAAPSRGLTRRLLCALRRPINIAFVVVLLAVMTTWWVALRPVSFFGGSASFLVVKGTSMLPILKTGDFVLAEAQPAYHVGDLVVYAVPKGQIGAGDDLIHRIVGGSATAGYTLKGDNNPAPDPWTVPKSDILGKEALVVPGAGNTLLVLRSPLFAGVVAAAIAVWLVMSPPEWMRRRTASVPPTASPEAEAVPVAVSLNQAPDPPAAVTQPRRRPAAAARAAVLTPRPAARTRSPAPATRRTRLPKP